MARSTTATKAAKKTTAKATSSSSTSATGKTEPATKKFFSDIPAIHSTVMVATVTGVRPLIMNQMANKTLDELEKRHTEVSTTKKKQPRKPEEEFAQSLHTIKKGKLKNLKKSKDDSADTGSWVTEGGIYGAPACWFKHALVSATSLLDKMKTRYTRTGLWVIGDDENDLIPITDDKGKPLQPQIHRGWVRTQGPRPVAMVRWRGMFKPGWQIELPIYVVDVGQVNPVDIQNLLNHAGLKCGVGEGRPSKTPALGWGLFRVKSVRAATAKELEKIDFASLAQ